MHEDSMEIRCWLIMIQTMWQHLHFQAELLTQWSLMISMINMIMTMIMLTRVNILKWKRELPNYIFLAALCALVCSGLCCQFSAQFHKLATIPAFPRSTTSESIFGQKWKVRTLYPDFSQRGTFNTCWWVLGWSKKGILNVQTQRDGRGGGPRGKW